MSLPGRIKNAIAELDRDTANIAEQMPAMQTMRDHQRTLSSLVAEAATVVAQAKRNTIATYVTRRRLQAERFRKARSHNGMTAKDAEEESKIFVGEEYAKEMDAEEHLTLLELLIQALRAKLDFCRDVANDCKWIERSFTSNNP